MNFSSSGREEPAGFNLPGFESAHKRRIRIPNPKTNRNVRFKIRSREKFPLEKDLQIIKDLEFKEWRGLPRGQDNGCNQYILIMLLRLKVVES
jgi:hypothetical protein